MPETRSCQNCKQNFAIEPEDFKFYEKISVPPPTWCPECRAMRRLQFRNLRQPYKRVCAATGKDIFTLMPPEAPMPVYSGDYWRSDAWDPLAYGRDYDFTQPFFEQIKDLFNAVPWAPMWDFEKTNSDYSISAWVKNCYMCFDTGFVEDSAYAVALHHSKQCIDVINCENCELCYYCINTNKSYKTFFSRNCTSCIEVWFSQDCIGCTSCFGCTGLRNKSYYIFNKPYTKEEYKKKLEEMKLDSFSGIEKAFGVVMSEWKKYPVKYQHSVQANGCTGDYIYNSAKIRNSFFVGNSENCAYSQSIIYGPIKDCIDISSTGLNAELDYEIGCSGDALYRTSFASECGVLTDCQYVFNCKQDSNLFGCVGVRNKSYCVLNKQYTKDEYENLVSRIRKHMDEMPYIDKKGRKYKYGEFFPPDVSPFGYNDTQAQEYFPLTKEGAESFGYSWRVPDKRNYSITKSSKDMPDAISDTDDSILNEVIQCMHDEKDSHSVLCGYNCATAFLITPQELKFYRQLNLPLPRLCFNCRHWKRVAWRNLLKLYKRQCMCLSTGSRQATYQNTATHEHGENPCPNEFETTYVPDRPEIVYCEACYNKEVA